MLCLLCGRASAFVETKVHIFGDKVEVIKNNKELLASSGKWFPYPEYSDRNAWKALSKDFRSRLVANGEKALAHTWTSLTTEDYILYSQTGRRAIFNPEEANREALKNLALAELVEGEGRFLEQIAAGLDCFCNKITWSHPQHIKAQRSGSPIPTAEDRPITYHSAYNASTIALVWYFLHTEFEKTHPGLSNRVKEAIYLNILKPYLDPDQAGQTWMGLNEASSYLNNHTTNENMHCTLCFLLMEDNPDTLLAAISKSLEIMDKYLSCIKHDGACEEGSSYWKGSFGKLYQYCRMMYDFTGGKMNLLNWPLLRKMGEYKACAYMGDGYHMNYGDGAVRDYVSPGFLFRFGYDTGSDMLKDFALYMMLEDKDKFINKSLVNKNVDLYMSLETMRYEKKLVRAQKTALERCSGDVEVLKGSLFAPKSIWYPETQYAILRNGRGWTLAAKGATNGESHNHNDVGSCMLYIDNVPILVDPGVGTYTAETFGGPEKRYSIWTMRSDWHNIPVINACLQLPGNEYASSGNVCDTGKNTFTTHIQGAYDSAAACKNWERSYSLKSGSLVITDKFSLEERRSPDTIIFIVRGSVSSLGKGRALVTARSFDGKREMKVIMSYPASLSMNVEEKDCTYDSKMKRSWGESLTRISLVSSGKASVAGKYSFTFKRK